MWIKENQLVDDLKLLVTFKNAPDLSIRRNTGGLVGSSFVQTKISSTLLNTPRLHLHILHVLRVLRVLHVLHVLYGSEGFNMTARC